MKKNFLSKIKIFLFICFFFITKLNNFSFSELVNKLKREWNKVTNPIGNLDTIVEDTNKKLGTHIKPDPKKMKKKLKA